MGVFYQSANTELLLLALLTYTRHFFFKERLIFDPTFISTFNFNLFYTFYYFIIVFFFFFINKVWFVFYTHLGKNPFQWKTSSVPDLRFFFFFYFNLPTSQDTSHTAVPSISFKTTLNFSPSKTFH